MKGTVSDMAILGAIGAFIVIFTIGNIIQPANSGQVYDGPIAPGCLKIDYTCLEAWKEEKGLNHSHVSGYRYK